MNQDIQTLEKIVDSGVELFGKHGFSGTSISSIAKNANVSKGILYYYFKSKDELYLYCAHKCIDEFELFLDKNARNIGKDENAVFLFLQLRLNFFQAYPKYQVLFYTILSLKPEHLNKQLSLIVKTFQENNVKRYISFLETLTLGKGITKQDCVNFLLLLQNSSYFTSIKDVENLSKQEQAMLNISKIFFNGLKEDLF